MVFTDHPAMTSSITARRLRTVGSGLLTVVLAAGLSSAIPSVDRAGPSRTGPLVLAASRTRPAASRTRPAASRRQQQVQAIADSSGWNWRSAGVTYQVRFHPEACCHWGIYDWRTATIYIGPTAFASPERLRYVVLHETAHAWQYRAGPTGALMGHYARWGYTGANGLEAGADCIGTLWGAARSQGHYWHCPDGALAVAAGELGRS
jgi:hypothetical protein